MDMTVAEEMVRVIVMRLTGRVDALSVGDFVRQADKYTNEGERRFVIDLSEVSFLDSAGIAALVSLLKKARKAGGDVKLVWPKLAEAQRILRLTKFDKVFVMADSAETALSF